jgi:hypothetical protein
MDSLQDFVSNRNIANFLERLGADLDAETRRTLLELLTQEQERLGRDSEQLEKAEQRVVDGKARIRNMRALTLNVRLGAEQHRRLRTVIATLEETQVLLEAHYQRLRGDGGGAGP